MLANTKYHYSEINLIAVSCSEAITRGILKNILHKCGNYEQLFCLSDRELNYFCQKKNRQFEGKDYLFKKAETILNECEKKKINIISILHPLYPHLLRQIYNPPLVLYYKGNIQPLLQRDTIKISIVGTRKANKEILAATQKISQELVSQDVYVISGMAVGVDTFAHRGALAACSKQDLLVGGTAAILGGGVDVIYPYGNLALYHLILEKDGVIISEYPPGVEPKRYHFPERNRIIAGISATTLLMQASIKSGALISVEHAITENREILVYQNFLPDDKQFAGNQKLLEDGATGVMDADNTLNNVYKQTDNKLTQHNAPAIKISAQKNSFNSDAISNTKNKLTEKIKQLTEIDKKIMQEMNKQDTITLTSLAATLTLNTATISARLFYLLLNDLVVEMPGQQYRHKYPICPNLS